MQFIKTLQLLVFQRMIEFQRGTMQSELAFVASQIAKLIFKDAFLLIFFVFPLSSITNTVHNFLIITQSLNLMISSGLAFILSGFLFLSISKFSILQQKFKFLIRLVIPWLDIFSLLIITVSIQLLIINLHRNVAMVAFNLISIVSISIIQIFYNLFHFTKEPRSNNLFKKRESQVVTLANMAILFMTYYISAAFFPKQTLSLLQAIVFCLLQFFISALQIKQRVYLQYYLSPFSQSVSSLFYFVQLYLGLLAICIYALELKLLTNNLLLLLGIMTILSYSALNAFIMRRNSSMFLSSASNIKDEDSAILYLDRLCELIGKVENEEEDIIIISLKKKHSLICKHSDCYCHREGPLSQFIKEYVREELQVISELFHNSPSILISILYFRLVVFKYYPQILAKLNTYASHFNLSLKQRYYRYCLTHSVTKFIQKKNYQIDALNSQNMFQLQALRGEIERLVRAQVEMRGKKWKYLSRGLCRVSELEQSCNTSLDHLSRLMQIYQQQKTVFRKSKEFNLLFLFYFIKVSFLNNGKEIRENLKELYYGYKQDELYTLKQFKKFIYHKRSCVIETVVDTKIMGVVSAASRNVEDMFGFPPSKIIGISINNLMPQFMADEHELILSEWAKSGTWRTIGKLKEIYCIHKDQYCFSALLYLKIYIKDNTMHFITNIFKLNDTDYLVINPALKIEGLGRKFLKMLGQPAKKMPLDLLIEPNDSLLNQQTYAEGKIYRKVLLGLRGLEEEVDRYLENINMKFDAAQRGQINTAFRNKLRGICQEKYFVEFSIKRYNMRSVSFLVLGLHEARKIERHQSIKYLQRHPTFLHNNNIKSGEIPDFEAVDSHDSSLQKDEDDDELLIQHNANSSLTSITEKENYPISKTIDKFINFVQHPSSISDARLSNFNILMLILLSLLTLIDFLSYFASREVLQEMEEVLFADGAQSDVMQTTEIGYSYIYMLRSQLIANSSSAQFTSTLQSARLVNSYVYALRQADFASLVTNVTVLSKERLKAYIEKQTVWSSKQQHEVLTHQFLENMYYLSSRVINQLQALKEANSTSIDYTLIKELFNNFPEMEDLNESFLQNYQHMFEWEHSLLSYLTIASMVVYLILSLILSIFLNRYFRFRFDQLALSFSFYSFIPAYFFEKMRDYYAQLMSNIVDKDRLKTIDVFEEEVFEIDTYDLFHKGDTGRGGLAGKVKFMNYESYYKWIFITIVFLALNAINYQATAQIRNFFPVSQAVIKQINDLMRSENQILQAYFDLRGAYSLNPAQYINLTLLDRLSSQLNQTQDRFNSFANQLTSVFSQYNPQFEANFANTLITSICKLTAPLLTPFENQKCITELKMNILDGGILISMNFFQKNVMQAVQDLRNQYILKSEPNTGDYFRQPFFAELDKMLIYMFKVYQLTQAVTFDAYRTTIQTITSSYLNLKVGITVFFIVVALLWLKSIYLQKKNLSYLYGHLLLVPFTILRANTRIVANLKESIEYSDY